MDGVLDLEGASDNTIGGDAAGEGNDVSASGLCGVSIHGSGTNVGIPAPQISGMSLASMTVSGTACGSCLAEVFANPDSDGEGKTSLGSTTAPGGGTFTLTVAGRAAPYLSHGHGERFDSRDVGSLYGLLLVAAIPFLADRHVPRMGNATIESSVISAGITLGVHSPAWCGPH